MQAQVLGRPAHIAMELLDRAPDVFRLEAVGRLRQQVFGIYDDLHLGRDLGSLVAEATLDIVRPFSDRPATATPGCNEEACPTDRDPR